MNKRCVHCSQTVQGFKSDKEKKLMGCRSKKKKKEEERMGVIFSCFVVPVTILVAVSNDVWRDLRLQTEKVIVIRA